ncbi:MAG: glycerol-3-phosphate acyltransferase [Chloroflexota bacterium]
MPWLFILLAYLIGAFPTAYLAGRVFGNLDIREVGDRNMGAANAFRQLSPAAGLAVGVIDAGKGALAVLLAQTNGLPQIAVLSAGMAAVIGHNWPVFIGFRGGRGVSTTIGVLLTINTLPMLICGTAAAIVLLWKRSVTPACAVLFISLPLVGWWLQTPGVLIAYGVALPCLVGVTHLLRTREKMAPQP